MLDVTEQGKPDEQDDARERVVRYPVRRTPNFLRFIITGAVLGFIVGAIIATSGADADGYSAQTGIVLIGAILAAGGALLAAIVALLLERLLNRQ
ncbi:hypothetical protein [Flexivirga oryzae]|uniref:Putative exporter of polyketide antibiotics n=1 Tax=Flexivirga oryzae TaxID=1794944 RepID=A0A839N8T4_9MICO|nr:putative exporter of polyketide antibiotics [Flexivirga oryzae]